MNIGPKLFDQTLYDSDISQPSSLVQRKSEVTSDPKPRPSPQPRHVAGLDSIDNASFGYLRPWDA
jgi:hypothetical protein